MTSPVLFSTGASPSTSTARNLVEFKAGKMELRDKMVHPIKRQGLVYLRQSADDNLMHFCWKDRQTGVTEDDLILFPDDCEFKRVKECTTGRVYVLKMKTSNKNMFFWMQEAKTEKDDEYCKKINDMLNNPPRAGSDIVNLSDRDMSSLFGQMTQAQMAELLSSNGVNLASLLSAAGRSPSGNSGASASTTASTANSVAHSAAGAANANVAPLIGSQDSSPSLTDLQALISGALMDGNEDEASALMAAATMAQAQAASAGQQQQQQQPQHQQAASGAAAGSSQQQQQHQPLVDLSSAINSESLAHLLSNDEFLRQIGPHLPPVTSEQPIALSGDERRKQFLDTVRSAQFHSSLSQFCQALQSGQLGPLMAQFGLNEACVDAANLGNLEAFVRALEAHMKAQAGQQQSRPPGDSQDS